MNYLSQLDAAAITRGYLSGYALHIGKRSEDTSRQGKSYLITLFSVIGQINESNELNSKIVEFAKVEYPRVQHLALANLALSTLAILGIYSKIGNIKTLVRFIQPRLPYFVHSWIEITPRKARILDFFSENGGNMVQVASAVYHVALFALGAQSQQQTAAALITMGVCALDRRGILPPHASAFINKRLFVISNIAIFALGSPTQKFFTVLTAICNIDFGKLRNGMDVSVKRLSERMGYLYPSLSEVENEPKPSSLKITKEMLYDASKLEIEVNPSHVAIPIPKSKGQPLYDYTNLLSIFDETFGTDKLDDKTRANVRAKLFDDERFFTDHQEQIIESITKPKLLEWLTPLWNKHQGNRNPPWNNLISRLLLKDKTESSVERWVTYNYDLVKEYLVTSSPNYEQKQLAKACYILGDRQMLAWARNQLVLFTQNISGKRIPKGNGANFEEIKRKSAILNKKIHDLHQKINNSELSEEQYHEAKIEIESLLLILAVDGGDYCTDQLTRAVNSADDSAANVTPSFVLLILKELAKFREIRFQQLYYSLVRPDGTIIPESWVESVAREGADIHNYNAFKKEVGLGLGLDDSSSSDTTVSEPGSGLSLLYPFPRIGWWSDYQRKKKAPIVVREYSLDTFKKDYPFIMTQNKIIRFFFFTSWCGQYNYKLWLSKFNQFAYTHKVIIEQIQLLFVQKTLSKQEYTDWWITYMANFDLTEDEQVDLIANLYELDGRVKPEFLKVMLVEMGILELA